MVPTWAIAATLGLWLAVAAAARAWMNSRERRRNAEKCAAARRRELARYEAGIPSHVPGEIGPPSGLEVAAGLCEPGGFYAYVAAQIEHLDITVENGEAA